LRRAVSIVQRFAQGDRRGAARSVGYLNSKPRLEGLGRFWAILLKQRPPCHSEEPQATKNLGIRIALGEHFAQLGLSENTEILRGVYPELLRCAQDRSQRNSEWAQDDKRGTEPSLEFRLRDQYA